MDVMKQNRSRKILLGEDSNALVWLIIINAVFFTALYFIRIVYSAIYDNDITAAQNFHSQVFNWFILPARASTIFTRPWVIFTYIFTHEGILAILSNLLWLWGFGYILQDLSGNKNLVPVYLYGGFAGGIFFLITANLLPVISHNVIQGMPLLGAGTAVMAVAIATTTLSPRYRIFQMINGGIPIWVLGLAYVLVDFVSIGAGSGPVAAAHIAAGVMGFIFIKQLQEGNDLGKWMYDLMHWIDNIFNPHKKQVHPKEQLFYKATQKPFEKKANFSQKRLDEILDKINQDGYARLNEEEKEFLKKVSHEDF